MSDNIEFIMFIVCNVTTEWIVIKAKFKYKRETDSLAKRWYDICITVNHWAEGSKGFFEKGLFDRFLSKLFFFFFYAVAPGVFV